MEGVGYGGGGRGRKEDVRGGREREGDAGRYCLYLKVTHTLQQVYKSQQCGESISGHNTVHCYLHSEGIGHGTQQVPSVHPGANRTNAHSEMYGYTHRRTALLQKFQTQNIRNAISIRSLFPRPFHSFFISTMCDYT